MGRIRLPTCLQARPLQLIRIRQPSAGRHNQSTQVQLQSSVDNPQENFDAFEEMPVIATPERPSPAARLARARENGEAHFKLGYKKIWLYDIRTLRFYQSYRELILATHRPDFPVTLIQTPDLDPKFAKFNVPLNMGKLDFRDFLWHGYQTRALNIRSWVYQRPVELSERTPSGKSRARWHRKKALKYMIVEMDEPFVWPRRPENFEDFEYGLFAEMKERGTAKDGTRGREKWREGTDVLKQIRQNLRQDAEAILAGKMKWRPTHEVYARPKYS